MSMVIALLGSAGVRDPEVGTRCKHACMLVYGCKGTFIDYFCNFVQWS